MSWWLLELIECERSGKVCDLTCYVCRYELKLRIKLMSDRIAKLKERSVNDIPEGITHIDDLHKYIFIDAPYYPLGADLTREWCFTYRTKDGDFWNDKIFIQHADTAQGAFESFVTKFPNTEVKRLEYIGLYW